MELTSGRTSSASAVRAGEVISGIGGDISGTPPPPIVLLLALGAHDKMHAWTEHVL